MEHEVLADESAAVRESVGEQVRLRVEQQSGGADAVAREDDDLRGDLPLDTVGIVVDRAAGHAVFAHGDLADAASGPEFHSGANSVRPIGDVSAGFCALCAASRAGAEIDALVPSVVWLAGDRTVGRPPVPTHRVESFGELRAGPAQGQGRHDRGLRRIGRISGQAGHAHHAVVLVVVGRQRLVVDRPVIRHAVQRPYAKVGGVEAGEVPRVQDRGAAHCVEVGDGYGRIRFVDGVVGHAAATVGADTELSTGAGLPVHVRAGVLGGVHPVALFETDDMHARVGQAPRDRGAGGARPDDQYVDSVFRHLHP